MTVNISESKFGEASVAGLGRTMMRAPAVLAAIVVAAGSAALVAGAYVFEHVLNVPPCSLCIEQRIPHLIAVPLGLVAAAMALKQAPRWLTAGALAGLALTLLAAAGLAGYHAGVEWKWWPGPADCSGEIADFSDAGSLMQQIQAMSVIRCDEAKWRLAGLSLAGYNFLLSLALASVAGWGLLRKIRRPA